MTELLDEGLGQGVESLVVDLGLAGELLQFHIMGPKVHGLDAGPLGVGRAILVLALEVNGHGFRGIGLLPDLDELHSVNLLSSRHCVLL